MWGGGKSVCVEEGGKEEGRDMKGAGLKSGGGVPMMGGWMSSRAGSLLCYLSSVGCTGMGYNYSGLEHTQFEKNSKKILKRNRWKFVPLPTTPRYLRTESVWISYNTICYSASHQ